jgi:glycosyltransferase involved in cell wall biosynthesis
MPVSRNSAARWPSVTVVIPTRGRPELLARALRSIHAQRYDGSIESLVVRDGAAAVDVPDLPDDPRRSLRVIDNARTPGLAGARNTGILAASAELLAFCDDDDEWRPGKIGEQVPHLLGGSDVSAVTCGIEVCYGDREVPRLPKAPRVTFADLLRDRLSDMHPSTFLARRRDVVDRIGLVDEEIPGSYAEDYDWLLRAARVAPIHTVQSPMTRVHWHASSYFEGRWDMIIAALQYLVRKHPEFEHEARGLGRIYGQIAFAHAAAGRAQSAREWIRRSLALDRRQPRPYLALLVSTGLLRPSLVLATLHRFGRGV